jgi:hypothetical protein
MHGAVKATIRTLNSNSNSPGEWHTFSEAQGASNPGDIILVSGGADYGTVTVTIPLTIIGTGWYPQNQDSSVSMFDEIIVNSTAAGTVIQGLVIGSVIANQTVADITLNRCNILNEVYGYAIEMQNWTIEDCLFTATTANLNASYFSFTNSNVYNCVFNGYVNASSTGNVNLLFNHCLFIGSHADVGNGNNFVSTYFNNCIFYGSSPTGTGTPANFNTCLSFQCTSNTFPNGSPGCFVGENPQFISFPLAGGFFNYNDNFSLANGSPAHNAGTDGTDLGISGGGNNYAWNYYGIPLIPQVNYVNISTPIVSPGGTVSFQFKSYVPH